MKVTVIAKVKFEDSSNDKGVKVPPESVAKRGFIDNIKNQLSSNGKVEILEFEMEVEE